MGDSITQLSAPITDFYAAKKDLEPLVKGALESLGQKDNPLLELLVSTNERIPQVLQLHIQKETVKVDQTLRHIARQELNDFKSEDTSKLEKDLKIYEKALTDPKTPLDQCMESCAGYWIRRERIALRKNIRITSIYVERWEQDLQFIVSKGEFALSKALNEAKDSETGLVQLFHDIYANARDVAEHLDADSSDLHLSRFVEFLRSRIALPNSVDRSSFQQLLDWANIPSTFELIQQSIARVNATEMSKVDLGCIICNVADSIQYITLKIPDITYSMIHPIFTYLTSHVVQAATSDNSPRDQAQPERNEPREENAKAENDELEDHLLPTKITMRVTAEEFSKRLGRAPGVLNAMDKAVFEALLVNFAHLNVEFQPYRHELEKRGPGMAAIKFIPFLQTRIRYGSKEDNIPFVFATTLKDMGDYTFWPYLCGITDKVPDKCALKKLRKRIPLEVWNNYLALDPEDMFPQLQFMDDLLLEAKNCNYGKKYQMYLIYGAYQSNPAVNDWSRLCDAMAENRVLADNVINFFKS